MTSAFKGFSTGIAPVVSYKYGSQDIEQLKKHLKSVFI